MTGCCILNSNSMLQWREPSFFFAGARLYAFYLVAATQDPVVADGVPYTEKNQNKKSRVITIVRLVSSQVSLTAHRPGIHGKMGRASLPSRIVKVYMSPLLRELPGAGSRKHSGPPGLDRLDLGRRQRRPAEAVGQLAAVEEDAAGRVDAAQLGAGGAADAALLEALDGLAQRAELLRMVAVRAERRVRRRLRRRAGEARRKRVRRAGRVRLRRVVDRGCVVRKSVSQLSSECFWLLLSARSGRQEAEAHDTYMVSSACQ